MNQETESEFAAFPDGESVKQWFDKREWLQGWEIPPHFTTNQQILAEQYAKNPEKWKSVFRMLKSADYKFLEPGKHDMSGDDLFFMINRYETRDPEKVMYEIHERYIDIQYVFEGTEFIGIAPTGDGEVVVPYSTEKDIAFVQATKGVSYLASPAEFFVFFPGEPHQPGVKTKIIRQVRKVVVKVKME